MVQKHNAGEAFCVVGRAASQFGLVGEQILTYAMDFYIWALEEQL